MKILSQIGIDDAGRGSLAGPIVYCAFTCNQPDKLIELGAKDSKDSDRADRQAFIDKLEDVEGARWWISLATPELVNACGYFTSEGTRIKALSSTAIYDLRINPKRAHFLLDGTAAFIGMPTKARLDYISQGDSKEPLISAASMIAKFVHDRIVEEEMATEYPTWAFESHRGYGSPQHVDILYERGPTDIHRVAPCETAIRTLCKKTGLPTPNWMRSYRERVFGVVD